MFANFKDGRGTPEFAEMERLWVSITENIHPYMCAMADSRRTFEINNYTMDGMLEHLKYWNEMKAVFEGESTNLGSVKYRMDKIIKAIDVVLPRMEQFKEEVEKNREYKGHLKKHLRVIKQNLEQATLLHLAARDY